MKLSLYILIIVLSTASMINAQKITVFDYENPISKAQTLRFDGAFNWSQSGSTVSSNNAFANVLYRTFYTSLPMAWFVNVDAVGTKDFSTFSHNVLFDASLRKYIWDQRDWFAFTRLTAQHQDFYKQIKSDLTFGFGYGRYINATALAKAVRIENHLIRDKIISDFLPKDVMIAIAQIIEREYEYRTLYGEIYETYLFADIEKEINKSNILINDEVGALGFMRMRQVIFAINERVNQRYYGWDVSAGILFPLTNENKTKRGNPNLTVSGRYSIPISWSLQVNTTADVFTPIDSSMFKTVTARVGLDFIYELSNRINFLTNYRLGIQKEKDVNTSLVNQLSASFWYYLENNIYLTLSADWFKQQNRPKVITTKVGLQYNLF